MGSNEDKTNYYNEYIEKQQLFVQKAQQQNTTLTSQLELYKERVRILENIKGDNNYLNEFLEADRKAKHFNQQAQSQFIRDQDIIRDLKQQRDKLNLAVIDYKKQKEEYQKTQMIFNQTRRDKEEKYLNDIIQLQAKNKDLENVVCKMGKSTETLRLLANDVTFLIFSNCPILGVLDPLLPHPPPREEERSLTLVKATPTIPVSAKENLGDPIDIRMDIIHPKPVVVVAFPAATVVRTLAQHGEAIRGIQEQLVGVPIQEELMALRFRIDIAEAEIASLRAGNKTTEAIEKITRNRKR
ncbi:hypothetical protein Tco_0291430 [Tanacetum coccineum]